jgi:hypothetical protein
MISAASIGCDPAFFDTGIFSEILFLYTVFRTEEKCQWGAIKGRYACPNCQQKGRDMAYTTFYDQRGRAVAWFDTEQDNPAIYLYSGEPVAWIHDESIYAYSGAHLGWLIDGWVRDHRGYAVLFTPECSGGPARPARQARPARAARHARPARGARQSRPARPARASSWSSLVGISFFNR